jgi:hypothetical protein
MTMKARRGIRAIDGDQVDRAHTDDQRHVTGRLTLETKRGMGGVYSRSVSRGSACPAVISALAMRAASTKPG